MADKKSRGKGVRAVSLGLAQPPADATEEELKKWAEEVLAKLLGSRPADQGQGGEEDGK